MVHLHFTEPLRRAASYAVITSSEKVAFGPPSSRASGEDLLKIRQLDRKVIDALLGLPASSVPYLASALFLAVYVLRSIMSVKCSREATRMGVGVASKMCQDTSDGPARQKTRCSDILVRQLCHAAQQACLPVRAQLGCSSEWAVTSCLQLSDGRT